MAVFRPTAEFNSFLNPTALPLRVDLLIPVFNEEAVILAFYQELTRALEGLPYRFRIVYINDGSSDRTAELLAALQAQDARVGVIEFSRNFGHQAALTAGLDYADADYVISLDGDGQHPPELIQSMLDLARSGYDVVQTQRIEAGGVSSFKSRTSEGFYRFINRIGDTRVLPGGADFRLLARPVVEALRGMREYHRFLRGMVPWVGFRTVILPYSPPARLAGQSKYSLRKMLRLAMDAVFSFSLVPLYIGLSTGALFFFFALIEVIYVLSFWVSGNQQSLAPGWSSLMFMLLVVGGVLMILLGFIGFYIGYIFQEVKGRPLYVTRKVELSRTSPPPLKGGPFE